MWADRIALTMASLESTSQLVVRDLSEVGAVLSQIQELQVKKIFIIISKKVASKCNFWLVHMQRVFSIGCENPFILIAIVGIACVLPIVVPSTILR